MYIYDFNYCGFNIYAIIIPIYPFYPTENLWKRRVLWAGTQTLMFWNLTQASKNYGKHERDVRSAHTLVPRRVWVWVWVRVRIWVRVWVWVWVRVRARQTIRAAVDIAAMHFPRHHGHIMPPHGRVSARYLDICTYTLLPRYPYPYQLTHTEPQLELLAALHA